MPGRTPGIKAPDFWIEGHSGVEVCEDHNQNEVGGCINPSIGKECENRSGNRSDGSDARACEELEDHLREKKDRESEDDWNNPGLVNTKR